MIDAKTIQKYKDQKTALIKKKVKVVVHEKVRLRDQINDKGDFICISNFPSAMLDVPIESSDKAGSLLFEAFKSHIPPEGTTVSVVLTPVLKPADDKPANDDDKPADGKSANDTPADDTGQPAANEK